MKNKQIYILLMKIDFQTFSHKVLCETFSRDKQNVVHFIFLEKFRLMLRPCRVGITGSRNFTDQQFMQVSGRMQFNSKQLATSLMR